MSTNLKKRNALGKGLSALLTNAETDITSIEPRALNSVAQIPISQIVANPFQPRTEFNDDALKELAESIRVHGLIQPITVRKVGFEKYELISGERRTRASILAGLKEIPAYIRLANDQEMLEMALVENIQRENLNAIEIALSYQRLADECGLKHEELGERVGKNRSTVNNYLRLLKLPEEIQAGIRDAQISMGHARALISVLDKDMQMRIFHRIILEELSVREVETLVRDAANGSSGTGSSGKGGSKNDSMWSGHLKELESRWGTALKIKANAQGKGALSISFNSEEELSSIVERLNSL